MKYVNVRFLESFKEYVCKAMDNISVGDLVVVNIIDIDSFYLARVVSIEKPSSTGKWVVQKVDLEEYTKKVELEKRIYKIKESIEDRRRKLDIREVYKLLATQDSEIKMLLEELEYLEGELSV